MGNTFLYGSGGGTQLNVKVIAVDVLPDTAKENTIAIITNTPSFHWSISNAEPQNPAIGDIWLIEGGASHIRVNLLKKNDAIVSLVACKQYTATGWIFVEAYARISNIWQAITSDIYKSGVEYIPLAVSGTMKKRDNDLYVSPQYYSSAQPGYIDSSVAFDITAVKTITVTTTSYQLGTNAGSSWGVGSTYGTQNLASRNTTGGAHSLDVSAVSGMVYFHFGIWGGNTAGLTGVTITIIARTF